MFVSTLIKWILLYSEVNAMFMYMPKEALYHNLWLVTQSPAQPTIGYNTMFFLRMTSQPKLVKNSPFVFLDTRVQNVQASAECSLNLSQHL